MWVCKSKSRHTGGSDVCMVAEGLVCAFARANQGTQVAVTSAWLQKDQCEFYYVCIVRWRWIIYK